MQLEQESNAEDEEEDEEEEEEESHKHILPKVQHAYWVYPKDCDKVSVSKESAMSQLGKHSGFQVAPPR